MSEPLVTILTSIIANGKTSKLSISIDVADREIIGQKTHVLGLALKRAVLDLLFETGVDVANTQLKQLKNHLAQEIESHGEKTKMANSLKRTIKLMERHGDN